MVLSEAMVLHSCPRASSTCSHSSLAPGAPRRPPVRRRSVAVHSEHGSSGSLVLSPSRWGGSGGGGGGEAGEAGTHPCNFPKENHPSLLPDAAVRSCRCFWPVPTALPAPAFAPAPTFQTKSRQSPRTGPSARLTTLRPSSLLSGRPEALVSVTRSVRPSRALLGRRLSLCHVPEPRPPVRAPLLFMMSEIGS